MRIVSTARALLLASVSLMSLVPALAQDHWVATWATSPQAPRTPPANAPAGPSNAIKNQTVRMVARPTLGGRRFRVRISNSYSTQPLRIGAAHLARRERESAIVANTDRTLTFSGNPTFVVPPGADIVSDPVDLEIPRLTDVLVSVFVPGEVPIPTLHAGALHTTYLSAEGDFSGSPKFESPATRQSWYFLTGIDVMAPRDAAAIVAFGDSITDGTTSTPDTDSSWPSQFSARIGANKATEQLAVVNEGIAGNRLLADGAGVSAQARFDRDVLALPGVKYLMIMEGINDIGNGAKAGTVSAADVIGAQKQLIERAHAHGIKVIGATLTAYEGAFYFSEEGEAMRNEVNQWIRSGKDYDAFVDFDAVTRDPKMPRQFLPAFNISDHLHPNDAGYKAMAEAIDLAIFKAK
jgi:lysophospholipase L1-like esterase